MPRDAALNIRSLTAPTVRVIAKEPATPRTSASIATGRTSHPSIRPVNDPSRGRADFNAVRSEEHTSELQSLMRISYAVFCLQKKKNQHTQDNLNSYTRKDTKARHNNNIPNET